MNYESTIPSEDADVLDDPEARAKIRRRLIIAAAVAVALLLAYIGYNYFAGAGAAEDDSASQAPTVTVMAPGKQQVTRTINATGTLAARREIAVSVVGEGGRVTNVYVDAGDWVKQGQIMASIDQSVQSQQAAGLEASVGVSRADLNLAQANLDRATQLVDRGFISKADIDRLTATRGPGTVAGVACAKQSPEHCCSQGRFCSGTQCRAGPNRHPGQRNIIPVGPEWRNGIAGTAR